MSFHAQLVRTLQRYLETWGEVNKSDGLEYSLFDRETALHFINFVNNHEKCFDRSNLPGHITGSALVLNHDLTKILLTHHKKLDMWLQLGGHADGHPIAHEVAMTEAREESGMHCLDFLTYEGDVFGKSMNIPLPFDLDRHIIPAHRQDPDHDHYDIRYFVVAENDAHPIISDESHDVRWFTFDQAQAVTNEASMLRQFEKAKWVKKMLKL